MAAPILINHRRDRQRARRVLADLRIRFRDLPKSSFVREIDPVIDGHERLVITHPCLFTQSRP